MAVMKKLGHKPNSSNEGILPDLKKCACQNHVYMFTTPFLPSELNATQNCCT